MFAFKELLRFYSKHFSAMHVAFLDASKAFDQVNRHKLLTKLEQRNVPKYIIYSAMSPITNVYVSDGDLPTRTSSQWATVLIKVGSYPLYFLTFVMNNLSVQLHKQLLVVDLCPSTAC